MKQRVYNTWLAVMVGALALPLLALCTPLFSSTEDRGLTLSDLRPPAERAHAPEVDAQEPALPPEPVLMSCADGSGIPEFVGAFTALPSPSPLWCEDTDASSRCAPAAPEPPRHDFGQASPALLATASELAPPAFILVDVRHTPRRDDLRGRNVPSQHDRPPRA